MQISTETIEPVLRAARSLPLNAPKSSIEDFFGLHLGLNKFEQEEIFPDPDEAGQAAIAISFLTQAREEVLREECKVPNFVVTEEPNGAHICGLRTYLEDNGVSGDYPDDFLDRLTKHEQIRKELLELEKGHHLEVLAAALLEAACSYGEATTGSGDQGVDAIGQKGLIEINETFLSGGMGASSAHPGEKVIIIASSKAAIGTGDSQIKLINPAHIRELVGSWVIQRSEAGIWSRFGIQTLTPLQLVLVTTYRLSEDSVALCRKLGIQLWGLPELIFLVCRYAPPEIFTFHKKFAFSKRAFREWWQKKDSSRLAARI
ncbi:MAG: hypothetical protein K0M48_00095 [Thiobacillus sp.]|nr:hypothetical protein [Thiobacillus sp.]